MTSEVQPSRFTGRTFDEALRLAAQQLQVDSPEDLQYRVVEERAGLLFVRPKVTIEAWISEPTQPDEVDARDDCGRVVIEGSAIRVVDQSDNGEPTPVKIFATACQAVCRRCGGPAWTSRRGYRKQQRRCRHRH